MTKRVAIFISGRGSNMEALVQACVGDNFPAAIVGVLADKRDAAGLVFAADHGIPARAVERKDFSKKIFHEDAMLDALAEWNVDILCLAGFMRILSAGFIARWNKPLINIHPSLLPLYPGLDTHARALADGVKVHGCTVHHVTAGVDEGPIIAQAVVPVLHGDDETSLTARVLKAEHQLYAHALRGFITHEWAEQSDDVVFSPAFAR